MVINKRLITKLSPHLDLIDLKKFFLNVIVKILMSKEKLDFKGVLRRIMNDDRFLFKASYF